MTSETRMMQAALEYHKMHNRPGKVAMHATKPLVSQQDLSLAYSPGVAAPCLEIQKDVNNAYEYTAKGNVVAVISNGTAVLGLGNLGAAAAKPVMEGKAVLFKKFADVDAIDIEVDTEDPQEFINVVKYLGHSWGGINLEDIKAPECFIIEEELKKLMTIPVFHDDQHGTAIITAAAMINALHITKRTFATTKIVVNGAGAAAIACIELLKNMGAKNENVILCDTKGVIYSGRKDGMNEWKEKHAIHTDLRTLDDAMRGADVFLGLSVKDAVTKDMVKHMAKNPIIFAMANPNPEITPEEVQSVRNDAIIATGRSDYRNQVNNVMGFPYIFRGALDVRAKTINMEMKIAAAESLAQLARKPVPNEVLSAYPGAKLSYGPEYIIPVPFDPRLITTIPVAVAKAAMDTGVAQKDLDLNKYKAELASRLNPTSNYMDLIYKKITTNPRSIILAEGEEEETIQAALIIVENGYGKPILIGRQHKITSIVEKMGSGVSLKGVQIMNAAVTDNLERYIDFLYAKLQRKGYLRRDVARLVKTDRNIFAACMVACGDGDCMVTGHTKSHFTCLSDVLKVIDTKPSHIAFSYSVLITKHRNIIIADNNVHELPSAEEIADIATQSAKIAVDMGHVPSVALLSFSNFGSPMRDKSTRIRQAVDVLDSRKVDFEYDGEMSAEVALNEELMKLYPFCRLSKPANILIMPALHTASIATGLLQELAGGVFIGPILTGLEHSVQIVQMEASASDIVNFAAIAAVSVEK